MYPTAALLIIHLLFIPSSKQEPLVVLPSSFRWNASNEILITPLGSTNHLVDVHLHVTAVDMAKTVYMRTLQAKVPGSTVSVKFDVPGEKLRSRKYHLMVQVENDEKFESIIAGRPDVRTIRVITDKAVYRPSEIVHIRAIPIKEDGNLYLGAIQFSLVNPDGFELTKKSRHAKGRFITTEFQLPEHLNFGEWEIVARALEDLPQNSFSASFDVQDYVLPSFRVFVTINETDQWDMHLVTVIARYAHGTAVSGNILLECEPIDHTSTIRQSHNERHQLVQAEFVNGFWSEEVNVSGCWMIDDKQAFTVIAEIREWGAGKRGEGRADADPQSANFELIPLRPGFKTKSAQPVLILVRAFSGDVSTRRGLVEIETTCICKDRRKTQTSIVSRVNIGDILSLSLDDDFVCRALRIQAFRKIGSRISRKVTLILPSFDNSPAINFDWISTSLPHSATFNVGDKFRAFVPIDSASKLNYLVVCNKASIATAGRARDDGLIIFEINSNMIEYCVLYVFNIDEDVRTDMILFFVRQQCPYSISVSTNKIVPSETINITLKGGSNGLATLSAIDARMLRLFETLSSTTVVHYWDLSFFNKPELKDDQIRLINFLDPKSLIDSFNELCHEAGILFLQHLKNCPQSEETRSIVSYQCLQTIILACDHALPPISSAACDRNVQSCELIKLAGMPYVVRISTKPPLLQYGGVMNDAGIMRGLKKPSIRIRELFPEVWLFDDFILGRSGRKTVQLNSPDSVTQWAISSSFWSVGDMDTCSPVSPTVTSSKDTFIAVEVPNHVYVNETITARVTVVAENIDEHKLYSVCLAGLQRHVCGDIGTEGERGQPTYTRIEVSPAKRTATKSFTLRFLSTGESEVIFKLKDEDSYPGKYHCDVGIVYDMVKIRITIAKRAETEEHFKRIILNSEKPLNILTRSTDDEYILLDGETSRSSKDIIEYNETRSPDSPRKLLTNIRINLADTETIHSFTIELSKFLSTEVFIDEAESNIFSPKNGVREKRAIWWSESFLTDVLKSLSSSLYLFKSLHLSDAQSSFKQMESCETRIGSLMSEMLTFSDCRRNQSCGFGLYRHPQHPHERSFFLSVLSTSLLCEANADEHIVCSVLSYLLDTIELTPIREIHDPWLDRIDFKTHGDRHWFLVAFINQLSYDCALYRCLSGNDWMILQRNDKLWIRLRRSFLSIQSNELTDLRSIAALAFMAPKTTADLMRIRMYATIKEGSLPFWTAGRASDGSVLAKLRSRYNDLLGRRLVKSGDLLVNSLGTLAFVNGNTHPIHRLLEFDPLIDWIHEQLNGEREAPTALETYFANRAIYEYRLHKQIPNKNEPQIVNVQCPECKTKSYNVSDTAILFYLPSSVRNLTLITEGHSKIRVGVRVLANKRQRLRRELGQDDYYPVTISVVQRKTDGGAIRQEVCLRLETAMIDTLEITHGLFTGFTTTPNHFHILPNTSFEGVHLANSVVVSSYAAHFVLTNLKAKMNLCYELGLVEPRNRYQPNKLAPVAITARHSSFDVIGQSLITHLDRSKRANIDETIETVCWQGTCSCAETTCTVRCGQCRNIDKSRLKQELCVRNSFGAAVEVRSVHDEVFHNAQYTVVDILLEHWKNLQNDTLSKPERMEVWLRKCNRRCLRPNRGDNYYFGGDIGGIVVDHSAKMHYVLREDDRWEKATDECGHLFSHLFTITSCV